MDPEFAHLLKAFLAGAMSRRELTHEINSFAIWNAWQDNDPQIVTLRDVVGEIELVLADVDEGFRDEAELRQLAYQLLEHGSKPNSVRQA